MIFVLSTIYIPASPIPASAIKAQASSEFYPPLTAASLTIDGSGLTGDLHDNHPQGHTMWLSVSGGGGNAGNNPAGVAGPAWLLYEFNQPYRLEVMWVWNHNQLNLTNRGLRYVKIHYSLNKKQWTLLTQTELERAPGTPNYAHSNEIYFNNVTARYVLITAAEVNGNYGSVYYGLSE
ncbi:MAG: discoidin domain-containing protein, partial [Candidatus Sumerlaeia bacterium]|nr:discoidin domain-containing protein [Candidatus Sumerlaeia bacterium]